MFLNFYILMNWNDRLLCEPISHLMINVYGMGT